MRSLSYSKIGEQDKFSFKDTIFFMEIQTQHLLLRSKSLTLIILFIYFSKCLSYGFGVQSESDQIIIHKNAIYSVFESYYNIFSPLYLVKIDAVSVEVAFFFCVVVCFLTLLLQIIMFILSIRKQLNLYTFYLYANYRSIYYWLIFPYVTEFLLLPFICSDNTIRFHNYGNRSCSSKDFLVFAIIGGISQLINILFGYYTLMFTNKSVCLNKAKNVDKLGRLSSKMENQLFVHQIALSFLSVLTTSPNLALSLACSIINILSYSYCFIFCWEDLHIKSNKVLRLFSSFFVFTIIRSGLRAVTLILEVANKLTNGFEFYATLIIAPIVYKAIWLLFRRKMEKIYLGSAEDIENPIHFMKKVLKLEGIMRKLLSNKCRTFDRMKVYGIMQIHVDKCQNPACFCKNPKKSYSSKDGIFINENSKPFLDPVFMKHFLKHVLLIGLKKYPKNMSLLAFVSLVCVESLGLFSEGFSYVSSAGETKVQSPLDQIALFYAKELMEKKLRKKFKHEADKKLEVIEIEDVFQYESKLQKISDMIAQTTEITIKFWNELSKQNVEVVSAVRDGKSLLKNVQKLENLWQDLETFTTSHKYQLRYHSLIVGSFMYCVANQEQVGLRMFKNISENIITEKQNDKEKKELYATKIFDSDTLSLIVGAEEKNNGIILRASANSGQVLGINKINLIQKSVEILMPRIFETHHRKFLTEYRSIGKERIIGGRTRLFAKNFENHIVPIILHVKFLPNLTQGLNYLGLIKKLPDSNEFLILTHHNGLIDGMSEGLNRILNLKVKKLRSNKFSIFSLCNELQEIYWNLNLIRERDELIEKDNFFENRADSIAKAQTKRATLAAKTMNIQAEFQNFRTKSFNEHTARGHEKNFCTRGAEVIFRIPRKITNNDYNSRGTNPATFGTLKTTVSHTQGKENETGPSSKYTSTSTEDYTCQMQIEDQIFKKVLLVRVLKIKNLQRKEQNVSDNESKGDNDAMLPQELKQVKQKNFEVIEEDHSLENETPGTKQSKKKNKKVMIKKAIDENEGEEEEEEQNEQNDNNLIPDKKVKDNSLNDQKLTQSEWLATPNQKSDFMKQGSEIRMESSTLEQKGESSILKISRNEPSEEKQILRENFKKQQGKTELKNERKQDDGADDTQNQEKILFGNFSKLLEMNTKQTNINIEVGSQASRSSGSQNKKILLLQHIIQKKETNQELKTLRKFFYMYFICLVTFASVTFSVNWGVLSNLQNSRDLINLSDHKLSKLAAMHRSAVEISNINKGYVGIDFLQILDVPNYMEHEQAKIKKESINILLVSNQFDLKLEEMGITIEQLEKDISISRISESNQIDLEKIQISTLTRTVCAAGITLGRTAPNFVVNLPPIYLQIIIDNVLNEILATLEASTLTLRNEMKNILDANSKTLLIIFAINMAMLCLFYVIFHLLALSFRSSLERTAYYLTVVANEDIFGILNKITQFRYIFDRREWEGNFTNKRKEKKEINTITAYNQITEHKRVIKNPSFLRFHRNFLITTVLITIGIFPLLLFFSLTYRDTDLFLKDQSMLLDKVSVASERRFKENLINAGLAQMINTKSQSTIRGNPVESELTMEIKNARSSYAFWVNFFNSDENKLDDIFQIVIFGNLCPYANVSAKFCDKYNRFIQTGIFTLHYNIHNLIDRISEEYFGSDKGDDALNKIIGNQNWMDLNVAFDMERSVLSWMVEGLQARFLRNFDLQFSILEVNILVCVLITFFSLVFLWQSLYINMLEEYYNIRCLIGLIPFDIMTRNKILISFLKNLSKDAVRAIGKV